VSASDAQSAAAAAAVVSGSRLTHAHPAALAAGYYLMPGAAYQSPYASGLCAAVTFD